MYIYIYIYIFVYMYIYIYNMHCCPHGAARDMLVPRAFAG